MDNEKKKDIELNTPEMNTETDSPITAGDLIKKLKSNLNQQTNNHNEAKENEAESLREDDVKKSGDGSENDHVSVTESVKRLIESLKENEEDESESKDTDKGNNAEAVTDEEESESTVNDQQSIEAAREEISEKEYSVVIEKKADKTNIFDPSTLKQNSKSKDKAKLFEENEQPAVAEAEQLTFNMTEDDIHKSIEEAEAFIYDRERIDNPEELINDAEGNTGEHSAFTQGSDEEGYDQTDLWIASAFGDEDEVKNKYGEKAAQEVETQLDIDAQEYLNDQNKEVKTVKIDQEFNSVDQIKEIFARYRKSHKMSLIKMAVCLLLVVAAFVFENISAFGGHLPGALNKNNYPAIYILASLQFLVFAGTVAYEELYRGVRALIKLAPLPESITACAVALSAIYHIVQCFVSETDPSVALYVSPVILCIFVTLLYDFLNLKREIYSFNIVASKRPKYTITAVETDNARLENEAFGEYLSGEEDISMFKIGKTGFVKGFYERMNSYSKSNSIISILLSVAAVSGLIFFIITTVLYDVKTALSFGYLAFVFATPACSLLAFSLPFYKASKRRSMMTVLL